MEVKADNLDLNRAESSTSFSMSSLIKIDMFSLSLLFVDHIRYECCAGGTTCNDLSAAGDLGGALSPPADPGQNLVGVQGAKPSEVLETLQLILAKNAKNSPLWSIYTEFQFCEFC